MWLADIKNWSKLNTYEAIKRTAENRNEWKACMWKASQKTTADDDELHLLPTFGKMRQFIQSYSKLSRVQQKCTFGIFLQALPA